MKTLSTHWLLGLACALTTTAATAEPVTYQVDPRHTFPAFEADHQGGLSVWRGKIERSAGTIVLDREARSGTVEMIMDMDSINFGLDDMTTHAKAEDILDVARFPTATYTGRLIDFGRTGVPTAVEGEFTLHGITRPLRLEVTRFQCQPHHRTGVETCGADATATFNRDDFDVSYGKDTGFFMYVNLLLTVESQRVDPEES